MNSKHPISTSADQNYEIGPKVSIEILKWLNENARNRVIQLPIEITLSRLGRIENSYLSAEKTQVSVKLDDSRMGISLALQIKSLCSSNSCRVLLEGTWGAMIEEKDKALNPTFSVQKLIGIANIQDVNVRLLKQ